MKKEIFEKMEGKEVVTPTSYKGVEGGVVQQQKGKLVKCQTCFGETDYIAYPQLAQLAVEALVPLQIGLAMGLEVKRVVVGEVMKERRRRERERLINLSTCGCVIQLYLWENTQFIEIREFGWGFLMLMS